MPNAMQANATSIPATKTKTSLKPSIVVAPSRVSAAAAGERGSAVLLTRSLRRPGRGLRWARRLLGPVLRAFGRQANRDPVPDASLQPLRLRRLCRPRRSHRSQAFMHVGRVLELVESSQPTIPNRRTSFAVAPYRKNPNQMRVPQCRLCDIAEAACARLRLVNARAISVAGTGARNLRPRSEDRRRGADCAAPETAPD